MRLLVCGGRDYDAADAFNHLEAFALGDIEYVTGVMPAHVDCLIHGGARGADEGAAQWGKSEHIKVLEFKADWKKHGKAAGPIRNQRMIDEGKPDVAIAFAGGRGTKDMVSRLRAAGVPVMQVDW